MFSNSVSGAESSSVVYTMVEMAKVHNLNVFAYLQYLLSKRPDEDWTDEELAVLAPWSPDLESLKH